MLWTVHACVHLNLTWQTQRPKFTQIWTHQNRQRYLRWNNFGLFVIIKEGDVNKSSLFVAYFAIVYQIVNINSKYFSFDVKWEHKSMSRVRFPFICSTRFNEIKWHEKQANTAAANCVINFEFQFSAKKKTREPSERELHLKVITKTYKHACDKWARYMSVSVWRCKLFSFSFVLPFWPNRHYCTVGNGKIIFSV